MKVPKYQSPANALSAFLPVLTQSYMANQWATQKDPTNPQGMAKFQQDYSKTKLGKGLSSNLGLAGLASANALIKDSSQRASTDASKAVESGLYSSIDAVAPGLGTAASVLGKATKALTRDSEGRYKNKFSMVAENLNPVSLIGNLIATKGRIGQTNANIDRDIRKESAARMREKRNQETLLNAQSNALALTSRNTYGTGSAFMQEGGTLSKSKGMPDKLNIDGVVFDMTTAVGKAMFNSWAKKNPKAYDAKMKELGFVESLPEYTVYGSKDEPTHDALTALKKQGVRDAFAIWGTSGSPKIRVKTNDRASYTGGVINIGVNTPEELWKMPKSKLKEIADDYIKDRDLAISEGRTEDVESLNALINTFNETQVSIPDFYGELAHSLQHKKKGLRFYPKVLVDRISHSDDSIYETPGTFENEAHSIIEPQLKERKSGLSGMGKSLYVKFEKGGSMKKKEKDCNCHQKADGIDTDVLKYLDTASVKKLQKAIGTVPDGKYKDSDKTALKKKAGVANIRLRDWLMKNSGIFAEITKAESLMMAGNEKPTIRI